MDKYNNPSGNTNSNDNNPWDYRPDQIDDTQEIPVVDNAEPVEENAASNGPDHTPEYTPSSDYNAPETEHKSHIGRNFLLAGLAAVAITGAVTLFNSNQTNAVSSEQPTLDQTVKYDNEESYTETTIPDNAYEMQDSDPEKVYDYNHSDVMNDGLDASEIASSMGYDSLLLAVNSEGTNEVASGIITSVADMGYASGSSWDMTPANGKTALRTNYGFSMDNGNGGMTLYTFIQDGNFYIQLLETNDQGDNIASYDYDSNVVPTPEEAAQILADNS